MTNYQPLFVSINYLIRETDKIRFCLYNRSGFSFDPSKIDVDYKIYCQYYLSVRTFVGQLPLNAHTNILKERVAGMPEIMEEDFSGYQVNTSDNLFGSLLSWITGWGNSSYAELLQNKINDVHRGLSTMQFMLKGLTSQQSTAT